MWEALSRNDPLVTSKTSAIRFLTSRQVFLPSAMKSFKLSCKKISSVKGIPSKYPSWWNAPKSMAKSPILLPIVIISSLVMKTPNGIFWIGKSEFSKTFNQDFLFGLLAVIFIKNC